MILWEKFKALGGESVLAIVAGDETEKPAAEKSLKEAREIIFDFESRFSRFIPGNELDDFNKFHKAGGAVFKVSETFFDILEKSRNFHFITAGIFDPAVISDLERAGYDRSFELISGKEPGLRPPAGKKTAIFSRNPRFRDLILDRKSSAIIAPAGLRLDLGGIGKGYLADLVAAKIGLKHRNFWLSLGGDMFLSGRAEDGDFWKFGIQNPLELEKDLLSVCARKEKLSVATSGITKRKGGSGDFSWHHLIDPRAGLPAKNDLLAATVFSDSVVRADVFAKTILILGRQKGLEFIEEQADCEAIIIDKDLNKFFSSGAKKYIYV